MNCFCCTVDISREKNDALINLLDWQIAPILTPSGTPVGDNLRDAEALTRAKDGSFWVAFEGVHRLWRYAAPPLTMKSVPETVEIPAEI